MGDGLSKESQATWMGMKKDIPLLTLSEWQKTMKQDAHSVFARVLRPFLATENLTLQMILGEKIKEVACQPVAGIEMDFYGHPLPQKPLPGPFQSLVLEEKLADRSDYLEFRGPYNGIKAGQSAQNVFILRPTIFSFSTQ